MTYIKDEYGLLISSNKAYFSLINASVEIWVDTYSKKQTLPDTQQIKALNDFHTMDQREIKNILLALAQYKRTLTLENRIVKSAKPITDLSQLNFRQIILPKQNKTSHSYLLIYADTPWKIRYSPYNIELEILFKNNQLLLLQESAGLWARLEWNNDYNITSD